MHNPPINFEEKDVDHLMYKSYEAQRINAPHIEPELWRKLYVFAGEYEQIYQTRINKND